MAVIELGLVHPDDDDPYPGPSRRPLPPRERRRLLVAVVAVCCVLTVTGSARPEPHGLPRLWSIPFAPEGSDFQLVGDGIYVLSRPSDRLTAYDARSGVVRWSIADLDGPIWMTAVQEGVLLLPTGITTVTHAEPDGTQSSREFSRDTVAIDAATGRQLWRARGEVAAALGDRVLLAEWNATGERARRLRMVRLRDGAAVWSRDRGELAYWTTDTTAGAQAERVVTVDPRGGAEVLAIADGSVVTTGRLPWTEPTRGGDNSMITVTGRRLHLDQTVHGESSVTAYDTDTLRRLWRSEQPWSGGSYECGPLLCISDGFGISGQDWETGALRWRLPGALGAYPLPDGRMIVDEAGGARRTLLDGATGRRLADLGQATPVWDALGRAGAYLVADTRQPAGLASVSRLDPASGEVVLRGAIMPVLGFTCKNQRDLLVCVTQDSRLVVTDVG